MKKNNNKRKMDETEAVFRLILSLDVSAEDIGAGDGYLFDSGGKKKKKKSQVQTEGFTLSLHDTRTENAAGACVCEITSRREEEWECLPQSDYFRYTDAVALDLLMKTKAQTGLDLLPHICDFTIETPLTQAIQDRTSANDRLREKAKRLFPERQPMRIVNTRSDGSMVILNLERTDGYVTAPFRSGQTVRLFPAEEGGDYPPRAALCCSPMSTKEGRYTVAVPVDDGRLSSLRAGDEINVSAPEGSFCFSPLRDHSMVLGLADERGLPSFFSMASAIRDHLYNFKLTVILFENEDGAAPLADEWDTLCAGCSKVHLIRLSAGEGITADELKRHLPHEAYSVFICGGREFCTKAEQTLSPIGLPRKNVRRELR